MIRSFSTIALLFGILLPPAVFAAESAYTDINLDHCKTISETAPDEPGDFVSMKCKGYKDYPVYFKEGDVRQTVYFSHLHQEIIDNAFDTFGPFNHIGTKADWRLDGAGKPYAAILRFHIENSNLETGMSDKAHAGQVLVISRVGQIDDSRGCVVGYVDALTNPDPNALARQVADDKAAAFVCGKDKPIFYGEKGEKAWVPTNNFPEAETAQ
jgi:hypothetical protein